MVRFHHAKPELGKIAAICFLLTVLIMQISCSTPGQRQYDPREVDFTVQFNPFFDQQLYSSIILATLDNDIPIFSVSVTAPNDGAVLRVTIDSSSVNYVTYLQEVLPHKGKTYTFNATPKWKYDILRQMRRSNAVDFTFACYINDQPVDVKNLRLQCRTINECPLSLMHNGKTIDLRPLFAAYVNEDHPQIEHILTDILDQGLATRFSGYQHGPQNVDDQVFAVWQYALRRGITYSSISCTSNPSSTSNVQHIRLFDEVWNTRQANCIDACIFFASILRKIGIRVVIFVDPCHAYLGYYTDKRQRQLRTVETTITSWVNLPELQRSLDADGRLPEEKFNKISKYLSPAEIQRWNEGKMTFDQLQTAIARSLFEKAKAYNTENYEANKTNYADTNVIGYQQLDIELLRNKVQPIR